MITRNAIIICCPWYGDDYLEGAAKDLENMCNYLMSQRGGAWVSDEIICLHNPAWPEVKKLLNIHTADYQFIYFAGHGCSDENKKRYLSFRDQDIEDVRMLNHNPRQLVIVDACRVYYAAISGIPPAEDVFSSFSGETIARQVFDGCIERSDAGKIIVHATGHNTKAREERHGRGGAFTLSLLYTALNFRQQYDFRPIELQELLPVVKQTLLSQRYEQTPEVAYNEGNLHVPFLIDADQIMREENEEAPLYQQVENRPSLVRVIALTVMLIAMFRQLRR